MYVHQVASNKICITKFLEIKTILRTSIHNRIIFKLTKRRRFTKNENHVCLLYYLLTFY